MEIKCNHHHLVFATPAGATTITENNNENEIHFSCWRSQMTADTQFLEWCLKCLWIRVREHAEFEFFSDWNIAAYDEWLCVVWRKYIGQGKAARHWRSLDVLPVLVQCAFKPHGTALCYRRCQVDLLREVSWAYHSFHWGLWSELAEATWPELMLRPTNG